MKNRVAKVTKTFNPRTALESNSEMNLNMHLNSNSRMHLDSDSVMDLNSVSLEVLLKTRIKDLPLQKKNFLFPEAIATLKKDLQKKKIKITSHYYLSTEWFCADGTHLIAIPFYLFHPRLLALQFEYAGIADGGTSSECLKILRHEHGHLIDNIFRLKNMAGRARLFGKTSLSYPEAYNSEPSLDFVNHISDGYAQAHPLEDWAETFAVWLGDETTLWKRKYRFKALEKLTYLEKQMKLLQNSVVVSRASHLKPYHSLKTSDLTLGEYLLEKQLSALPRPLNKTLKAFAVAPDKMRSNKALKKQVDFMTTSEWYKKLASPIVQSLSANANHCERRRLEELGFYLENNLTALRPRSQKQERHLLNRLKVTTIKIMKGKIPLHPM